MKFDFFATLESDGARYNPRLGCLEDARCYYRISGNLIQVSVKSRFDRWANSVHLVFQPPKSFRSYQRLRARLDELADVPLIKERPRPDSTGDVAPRKRPRGRSS
jgi:hypothetical protein